MIIIKITYIHTNIITSIITLFSIVTIIVLLLLLFNKSMKITTIKYNIIIFYNH